METTPLQALIDWRMQKGLSQRKAAAEANASYTSWSRWEAGIRKPPVTRLPTLQRVTGLPGKVLRPDLAEILEGAA